MYRKRVLLLGIIWLAAITPMSAAAVTIFEDDFDAEAGAIGNSVLNYDSFANWTVSAGTVDVIADGDFNFDCNGKCVHLDGGGGDTTGVMTSTSIILDPGEYVLEFTLAGVSAVYTSSNATADNIVDVSLGSFVSEQFTVLWATVAETFQIYFVVDVAAVANLSFSSPDSDNFGAILDDVTISTAVIPEPGTSVLLGRGLLALGSRRRRVRSGNARAGRADSPLC